MRDAIPADRVVEDEPLVRLSDLEDYRRGLARHLAGEWDDEKWTAYRVRFGVYGQKQPGVQMVRVKVPGGRLPVGWLKALAAVNRAFAVGDAHITTRQDIQLYHVPLARTADMLEALYAAGLTTREACGNTLRNITACALSGACPRELTDAGRVADALARSWIRHPLVQHMPRKVKMTVSGCATDCGGSAIHDLAFVAVERGGETGFRVLAGGGLGSQPRAAVEVLDFVREHELPVAVESLARLHQRYSDRRNRNAARVKFMVKRFGAEKFSSLFREEFGRLRGLAQRPWRPLDWRQPSEAPVHRTPVGVLDSHAGGKVVVVSVPLGILSSDQLDTLHAAALAAGVDELRTTRDQNLAFLGVAEGKVVALTEAVRAIGLDVPARAEDAPDIISCPGTTTCRIGITNSQSFAATLLSEAEADAGARIASVHVSGCQNSCGLHHVADFGLHGMAKKIDGRSAPHYQLHLGGDKRTGDIGLAGPLVPARLASEAVRLLREAWRDGRAEGEGVRAWAERLGKDGLAAVLAGLDDRVDDGWFVDWGEAADFAGPPQARGECAAPFASDSLLADLADDQLILLDRMVQAGRWVEALAAAEAASVHAARRLLALRGALTEDEQAEIVYASLRGVFADDADVLDALDGLLAERSVALGTGRIESYREAVAWLVDTARARVEKPAARPQAAVGDFAAILAGGGE
ncbi:MAG: nitrite/sulfite reductase [Pseudomonadota bacterium]